MIVAKVEDNVLVQIYEKKGNYELDENERLCNVTIDKEKNEMKLKFPDGIVCIGRDCTELHLSNEFFDKIIIDVPDSVEKIDGFPICLSSQDELIKISVEFGEDSSLTSIGDYAFSQNSFSKITIPKGVNDIGYDSFNNCEFLEEVTLLDMSQIDSIMPSIFDGCKNLSRFNLPGGTFTLEETENNSENIEKKQDNAYIIRHAIDTVMDNCIIKHRFDPEDLQEFFITLGKLEINKMNMNCNVIRNCSHKSADTIMEILVDSAMLRGQKSSNTFNLVCGEAQNEQENKMAGYFTAVRGIYYRIWLNTKTWEYNYNPAQIARFIELKLHIILHEFQHARQHTEIQTGISSYSNLLMTKESLCMVFATKEYMNYHDCFFQEIDANKYATQVISDAFNVNQIFSSQKLQKVIDVNGEPMLFEDFISQLYESHLEKISNRIASAGLNKCVKNPFYTIIAKEYHNDGTPKSPEELIGQMNGEISEYGKMEEYISQEEQEILISDCKAMYFEILYRAMQKYSPEKMQAEIEKIGKLYDNENPNRLLTEMIAYYASRVENIDEEKKYVVGQVNPRYDDAKNLLQKKVNFLNSFVPELVLDEIVSASKKNVRLSSNRLSEIAAQLKETGIESKR